MLTGKVHSVNMYNIVFELLKFYVSLPCFRGLNVFFFLNQYWSNLLINSI